jgi:hypothetical protein
MASARISWAVFGSAVSFCWAKVGKAKLNTSPTRATAEPHFHCFLPKAQGGRRRVTAAFGFSVHRVKVGRPVGIRADLPSIALAD